MTKVEEVLEEMHCTISAAPMANAVKAIAEDDHFRNFVMYNAVHMLVQAGFGSEAEVVQVLRHKLYTDTKFTDYFYKPYMVTAAIGFKFGQEEKKLLVM